MASPSRLWPEAALLSLMLATGYSTAAHTSPANDVEPRTDVLGDSLPPGCVARLGTVRFRHGDSVHAAAFLPGGKYLASGSWGSVRVWEVATGKQVRSLPGQTSWMHPVFAPDGRFVAFWHDDGAAVWSTETGKKVWPVPSQPRPYYFGLAPDGRRIAVAAIDEDAKEHVIALYDFQAGKLLHTLKGHTHFAEALVFSADGKLLATGGHDCSVRLWDTAAGKELRRLDPPEERSSGTYIMAFAPDGKALIFVRNGRLHWWDWNAGTVREEEKKWDPYAIRRIIFTPDGKEFLVGRVNGTTSVWDAATFKMLREYPWSWQDPARFPLALSPDGKTVAAHYLSGLVLWDLESGRYVTPHRAESIFAQSALWSPDGTAVAVHEPFGTLHICDPATGQVLRRFEGLTGVPVAWPREGVLLTLDSWGRVAFRDDRTGKKLREFDSGNLSSEISYHVSPDGRWLLANYSYYKMFDMDAGKQAFLDFPGRGRRVAYSPDSKQLAVVYGDSVQIRDSSSGKVLKAIESRPARISRIENLVFSPDGQTLALSCAEPEVAEGAWPRQIVRLLDLKTGKIRHPLPELPVRYGWHALAFSPDGRLLAGTADDDPRIHLWDLARDRPLPPVEGHQGAHCWVRGLAFSPDGKRLLSTADDGCALVWDVAALLGR